jgi:TatD DNase family protein
MIDVHCHLEQKDYDKDRDEVIEKCRKELEAVIISCAHPKDFELTMDIANRNKGFVFPTVGIHPEYIKEISESQKDEILDLIKERKDEIVGIGEIGLDYNWVKETEWREKQKQQFAELIRFANELKKPIIVHSREAFEEVVNILEREDAKRVLLHLFGDNKLVKRIAENGWYISIGPIVLKSKKHYQITRDMPIELLMTETDAPWNAPEVFLKGEKVRNDPTSVKVVIEEISTIKRMKFQEVDKITTENAVKFFNLR